MLVNEAYEEKEDNLLKGHFNEEESSRSFQQALNQWRAENTHGDREHHKLKHSAQTVQPGNTHTHILAFLSF